MRQQAHIRLCRGIFAVALILAIASQGLGQGEVPPTGEGRLITNTVQLDILMVYTPAARSYAGGTNAMKAAIHAHLALANRCNANSDMPVVLRPVAIVETSYTEGATFNDDLVRLKTPGDSYMDEIHALRSACGGDLVALIRRNDAAGVAGLAYVNPGDGDAGFAPWAFSVTADNWASGNIAFPHEVGHNMGCYHDRGNSAGAAHAYAYGWRFYGQDNVQYITVMAYYPGSRIPYFSNPTISYQGVPTGVASGANAADNAMRYELTATGTAAYRTAGTVVASGVRGDFNGDGTPDCLMQNTATGERHIWLMSGGSRNQIVVLAAGSVAWQIAATADFNGDGKTDIIFQNTVDGRRSIWLMDGINRQSIVDLPLGNPAWVIGAAADFNADGKTDLLFNHTLDGRRSLWLMNGTTRAAIVDLPTGMPDWRMAAAGDFNADGQPDILFQNIADGRRSLWLMSGTTRAAIVDLPQGLATWRMVAALDMNADGHPDIIFENIADGRRSLWLMNGSNRGSIVDLPAANPDWHITNH